MGVAESFFFFPSYEPALVEFPTFHLTPSAQEIPLERPFSPTHPLREGDASVYSAPTLF